MAGQFCFCGDFGRGIDVGVGEDAGRRLLGGTGGVLFVVDGDAGEQGAVEDAWFGGFALGVEVVELVALGGQELACVLAGSFELIEHVVEDLPDVLHLGLGQGVALVGALISASARWARIAERVQLVVLRRRPEQVKYS